MIDFQIFFPIFQIFFSIFQIFFSIFAQEEKGVPAILVYKNGTLIGNFVRVTEAKDFFGRSNTFLCDFEVEDTESFLVDHGFLPDLSCVPIIVQKTVKTGTLNDGSDDE